MEKIRKRIVLAAAIGLCSDTSAKLRASSLIGFDQATLKGCKTPLNKPLNSVAKIIFNGLKYVFFFSQEATRSENVHEPSKKKVDFC